MPKIEIDSVPILQAFLRSPAHDWANAVVQEIDLRPVDLEAALLAESPTGSVLIGCQASPTLAAHFATHGAVVIPPAPPSTGFDPFRPRLYDAATLLAGFDPANAETSYRSTYDWRAYLASMDPKTKLSRTDLAADAVMFQRLHDFSIDDALRKFLHPAGDSAVKVVGIMGGHDRERAELAGSVDSPYTQVAILAWRLARAGFTIATGGGPGAMEAGNLGAWFAGRTEAELRAAIRMLAAVPVIRPIPGTDLWNSGEWMAPAFAVRQAYPLVPIQGGTEHSLGVPTWFYGHEPPNPFATHIAKYFQNSVREDGMLALASHGVIFAEGNAGTVQEIFQDACKNYYAVRTMIAPMVLFGSDYWNGSPTVLNPAIDKQKPVYPLLLKLAQEKKFSHLVALTDSIDDVVAFITSPPTAL